MKFTIKDLKPGDIFKPLNGVIPGISNFNRFMYILYEQSYNSRTVIVWVIDSRWTIRRLTLGKSKNVLTLSDDAIEPILYPEKSKMIIKTLFEKGISSDFSTKDIPVRIQ
jgi:hypothetical protein